MRAFDPFAVEDRVLLAECDVDTYRASGPGGQHRNRTESAVRLRHRPSGIAVHATESRSQIDNRKRALRRLREALAIGLRAPAGSLTDYCAPELVRRLFDPSRRPAQRNPDYTRAIALLLDVFVATGCSLRDTAAAVRVSTGGLVRRLGEVPAVRAEVNRLREARGLGRLR